MLNENYQSRIKELNSQIEAMNKRHDLLTEILLKTFEEQINTLNLLKEGKIDFKDFENLLKRQKKWIQNIQIQWYASHPARKEANEKDD